MGMSVGDKDGGGMLAEINVTPLVDVMLVLIIIFMVVAQALASGVNVELPSAKSAEESRDVGQNISIVRGDQVALRRTDPDRPRRAHRRVERRVRTRRCSRSAHQGRQGPDLEAGAIMDKINENGMSTMLLAVQKERVAMGFKVGEDDGGGMVRIGVTTLIDVMLVMLVIFAIITPPALSQMAASLQRRPSRFPRTMFEGPNRGRNLRRRDLRPEPHGRTTRGSAP